ncbi:hypothetical protein [Paenibacillus ihuae]|uniref:hypothetical protein n=1 Tax=Paenibacillus ihuae TaxID=1232431 RepID=UPI000B31AB01|nr:hypothetical protein [Paenibacillus ihuae]
MLRIWMFLLSCMLLFGIVGCSEPKVTEVDKVRLECVDLCTVDQQSTVPFTETTFTGADEIRTFVNAIDKSVKMSGELDYGTYFLMHVSYKDDSQKTYVLNISDSGQKGIRGLLVDTEDSGQGYEIPASIHEELRELIYRK